MRCILAALAITTAMAVLTPVAAEAEGKVARVGRVYTGAPSTTPRGFAAFTEGLRELGWTEGRNLVIESRWAEGHDERLPALIRELIERKVDVIVVTGTAAAVAAKQSTSTVPIVVAAVLVSLQDYHGRCIHTSYDTAAVTSSRMTDTTHGRWRIGSGTGTFRTQCGTPSWLWDDLRTFGGTEKQNGPRALKRNAAHGAALSRLLRAGAAPLPGAHLSCCRCVLIPA